MRLQVASPSIMTTTTSPPTEPGVNRELAERYDSVGYAAQANALSHPTHIATVATLLGLAGFL